MISTLSLFWEAELAEASYADFSNAATNTTMPQGQV
jgi:hypothetical protein